MGEGLGGLRRMEGWGIRERGDEGPRRIREGMRAGGGRGMGDGGWGRMLKLIIRPG